MGPKSLLASIAVCSALAGCASPSQVMVNDQGQQVRCSSSGYGLMGVATAVSMKNSCVEDHKKMGFREAGGEESNPVPAENPAAIEKLKGIGYENPTVSPSNGYTYLVSPSESKLDAAGEAVLVLATVYPAEKLFSVPGTKKKFFGEYQVERYVLDADPRIATITSVHFYRSDGSLAHSDVKEAVIQVAPDSPLSIQRKHIEATCSSRAGGPAAAAPCN